LRNIASYKSLGPQRPFILGESIHVRLEDCAIPGRSVVVVRGESTVYANRCFFEGRGIAGDARTIFIDNSTIIGGAVGAGVCVVQNSAVATSIGKSAFETTDVFLADNTYPDHTAEERRMALFPTGVRNGNAYIYGNGKEIPMLLLSGGNIHIYDCGIDKLYLLTIWGESLESLNMKNVIIRRAEGPDRMPLKGNWENVRIYPPVNFDKRLEYVFTGHKVTVPTGNPWKDGIVKITESDRPLEFAMPPVPTLEQLGLAQFWEAVDRGETPEPPKGLEK
jgi:hypothetical protein